LTGAEFPLGDLATLPLGGDTNYSNLYHAFYFLKYDGRYELQIYDSQHGVTERITWGCVVQARIVLKPTGADYYYKINNENWQLAHSAKSSTESPLYPSIAPKNGRWTIHSMNVYDRRTIVFNDGNVGIGTTNPGHKLVIDGGDALIRGGDGWNSAGDDAVLYLGNDSNYIKASHSSGVTIGTYQNSDAIFMNHAGNVGIGTTSPAAKLDVAGTVNATKFTGDGSALTVNDERNLSIKDALGNKLDKTGGDITNNLTIQADVGIGTTEPAAKLDVKGDMYVEGIRAADHLAHLVNMRLVEGAANGNYTPDGKFVFNDQSAGYVGGFQSNTGYDRVAGRVLEWVVDTSDAGDKTSQYDNIWIGWGGNSLAGERNYYSLTHAFWFNSDNQSFYVLRVSEGEHYSPPVKLTWGDVVQARIVLKSTGADYYYKINNGNWQTLAYEGTSSTKSPLYPSIATVASRYTIHSMRVYDSERTTIAFNGDNVGIGTASPEEKLHVVGNLRVDGEIIGSEGWTNLSLESDFQSAPDWQHPQYRKIGDIVYLRGLIVKSGIEARDTIATLPLEFSPPLGLAFTAESHKDSGKHRLDVYETGKIQIITVAEGSEYVALNGIFFSTT